MARLHVCLENPFPNVFQLLRPQYEWAVDHIDNTAGHERQAFDPDRQLGRHLMALYWRGVIDWDGLLNRFFARADDARRAEAVQYLGMSLAHEPSVPPEVLDRLRPSGKSAATPRKTSRAMPANWRRSAGGPRQASSTSPGRSTSLPTSCRTRTRLRRTARSCSGSPTSLHGARVKPFAAWTFSRSTATGTSVSRSGTAMSFRSSVPPSLAGAGSPRGRTGTDRSPGIARTPAVPQPARGRRQAGPTLTPADALASMCQVAQQ